MTKPTVTDEMVADAVQSYIQTGRNNGGDIFEAMKAALNASGLVERIAELDKALRKIENTEYINQLSGNMNFEILQSFALEALNKDTTNDL